MTPAFRIIHKNNDITAIFTDRLLSLKVTDEAGVTSDQLEITLDNRDRAIVIPEAGAELSIAMGYEGQPLVDMGRFTIDEIETSGYPLQMSIKGKAADMRASLKSWKKRSWSKTTLGAIVRAVSAEHGLTAGIAEKFRSISIDHLDQAYESDMNLLTRLAEQYGAVMKPAGGHLLFVDRGAGVKPDGTPLPTINISAKDITSWRCSQRERKFYARVGAHWRDKRGAKEIHVYSGSGEPVMYLRHPFKSAADAQSAAAAKLRQMQRGRSSISLQMPGNPTLCAEMPMSLSQLDPMADGEWIATSAAHEIAAGGFATSIEGQRRDDFTEDKNEADQ